MSYSDWGLFKTCGWIASILLLFGLQFIWPYRKPSHLSHHLKNGIYSILTTIVVYVVTRGAVVHMALFIQKKNWGLLNWLESNLLVHITAAVLLLDVLSYFWHRTNHQIPILWRFHFIHHSDRMFDVSTALRFHAFEIILSLLPRALVVAAFGISPLGLLVFELIYQFFNLFEHANLKLNRHFEDLVSKVFVTPRLHRRHHSEIFSDSNSNFSTIFSFWDRMFQTFRDGHEDFTFGESSCRRDLNLKEMFYYPFLK